MATPAPGEAFVTIVPVGEGRAPPDSSFVTVLTLGADAGAAAVVVRRPRGARLGLGLKFEGGSAAAEKVRRLLVQSCAEGSPAEGAVAPWGKLIPGDEILAIDGVSVSDLTRIDCVKRLKDSDEMLTLLVRHFEIENKNESKPREENNSTTCVQQTEALKALPPPVPPRKLGKKSSFKDKSIIHTNGDSEGVTCNSDFNKNVTENGHNKNGLNGTLNNKLSRKSSFDSHLHRQNKESFTAFKKGSPEEARRLVRRLSDGKTMPPEAEVYVDLLSTEWERCLADAESDDTGSSISTVVDRLSSMASSVENSIPSTPIMQPKTIDIQKVLNCIENIDTDILKDLTSSTSLSKTEATKNEIMMSEKLNGVDTSLSDNVYRTVKKNIVNDNNKDENSARSVCANKNMFNETQNKSENKPFLEMPKPLPRSSKVERSSSDRKPKSMSPPGIPPPPVPEPLLTPTKKNCIETWLQHSEAEMKNTDVERVEEVPEALPRLIDFVTKPQFKETESVPPPPLARPAAAPALARPTSAPPPPPPPPSPPPPPPLADTREDGSGASLDTIGELDEPVDVCDIPKVVTTETQKERKSSYESGFWEDRANKSDAEDKSLSNDDSPLPTCPRQPPDGVETPGDVTEEPGPPGARRACPPAYAASRPRYLSRTQDARSEASVKDKIAMFSNEHSDSCDVVDKCGTLPSRNSSSTRKSTNYSDIASLDRRLTKSQDNLDDVPGAYKRYSDRPDALGALESAATVNTATVKANKPMLTENKPLFYGSATALPSFNQSSFTQPVYHARSSSDDNGGVRKSNLEFIIEQRKKSMSKLRGLVIPEVNQSPIMDLPEIKVQDYFAKSSVKLSKNNNVGIVNNIVPKTVNINEKKTNLSKIANLSEKKWKADLLSSNMPKYSPAFKRKSLQLYSPTCLSKESTPERKFLDKVDTIDKSYSKSIPPKPPRMSLDTKTLSDLTASALPSRLALSDQSKQLNKSLVNNIRQYNNMDIKICTVTDIVDSDNDSAMSSTQSSYRSSASSPLHHMDSIESDSSRLSPRICHLTSYSLVKSDVPTKSSNNEKNCVEYVKRSVCRSVSSDTNISLSSSAGSAATSGSQASCSSLESSVADCDKKKVAKTYNIDTINRRNILASAKCRSGKDNKLNSPVIQTKFSHDSSDRSPSPQPRPSDRLSTLTPVVSAIANKGDGRRRNKVITETDSDTDEEVNKRQRKNDFKNARLKRNSSASNKTKPPSDSNSETFKSDDAPKAISERIIHEIKKAGLDNFNNTVAKSMDNNNDSKADKPLYKKEVILNKINPIKLKTNQEAATMAEKSKLTNGTKITSNGKVKAEVEVQKSSRVVRLTRGAAGGVGVILAGGQDCEAKEVTVHRVLSDSAAARAGLSRGVRVRSVNGHSMDGLTHAQSVAVLKEQRAEVILEIEDASPEGPRAPPAGADQADAAPAGPARGGSAGAGALVTVVLDKAGGGAGLGFGLDGGRDSPHGDRPLTVKKLFAGGAALRSGRVLVGAELVSAGGAPLAGHTRTQAWAALKALPAGPVALVLRNPQ